MEPVTGVLLLFVLIATGEALVETIKWLFIVPDEESEYTIFGRISLWKTIALGVSVLLTILAGADLFALIGVPLGVPVVGYILTGVIIARGAGVLNDLFKKIKPPEPNQN